MKNIRFHIVLWLVLIGYILSADWLHLTFFQKNGRPLVAASALPAPTKEIIFQLAELETTRYEGEELYQLRGFAFGAARPKMENIISIVLHSTRENLVFQTDRAPFPNIVKTYKKYTPALAGSEFRALISKNALKIDNYQIGILLQEKNGTTRLYMLTGNYIERTPNTLRYITGH